MERPVVANSRTLLVMCRRSKERHGSYNRGSKGTESSGGEAYKTHYIYNQGTYTTKDSISLKK